MNPLTLILKNLIFTALLVVLLFKVRKPGSLLLFVSINALFSMLLMGGEFMLLPAMLLGGVIAEGLMAALGGYRSAVCLMVGVALYDLFYKSASLTLSWLFMREQPQIVWMASIIVAIGYLGAIAGLFVGLRFVKELRHAGIIRV
jgi:energy-coupling factor transport system substrate-specific component